jgi:rubrerythrin
MPRSRINASNGRSLNPSHSGPRRPNSRRPSVSMDWIRDFFSEMLAVEMGGIKLYQKALDGLEHPELEEKLTEFLEQTEHHAELCKQMLNAAGAEPDYVSPNAEIAEQKAEALLSTEAVAERSDVNNLENLVLAETKDHWNWEMLGSVATKIEDPELKSVVKKALREVSKQEKRHVDWNQKALTKIALELAMESPDEMESASESEELEEKE